MDCDEFSGVAAELALGVLAGRERADALAHLERCGGCREMVRQLAMTGEELLALLPAAEPPPGFETRVLARLPQAIPPLGGQGGTGGRAAPPFRGSKGGKAPLGGTARRLLAAAAVTLAAGAAGLGGWSLRGPSAPPPAPGPAPAPAGTALASAALVSPAHQAVGEIYYHGGARPWMYMSVELPAAAGGSDGAVTCELEGPGGVYTTAGAFRLVSGYGAWGSPAPWGKGPVTGARILAANGTVLATARFPSPR